MVDRPYSPRFAWGLASLLVALIVTAACGSPTSTPSGSAAAGRGASNLCRALVWLLVLMDRATPRRHRRRPCPEGIDRRSRLPDADPSIWIRGSPTRARGQIEERAAEALEALRDFAPNILFVTDDVALEHVAVRYAEESPDAPLPTVFAGINVDPTIYAPINSLEAPGRTITGALGAHPARPRPSQPLGVSFPTWPGSSSSRMPAQAPHPFAPRSGATNQAADDGPFEVLDFRAVGDFRGMEARRRRLSGRGRPHRGFEFPPAPRRKRRHRPSRRSDRLDGGREQPARAWPGGRLGTGRHSGRCGQLGAQDRGIRRRTGRGHSERGGSRDHAHRRPQTDRHELQPLSRARSLGIEIPSNEVDAADSVFETIGGR